MDPELQAALDEMGQAHEAKFSELETKFDEKLQAERDRADQLEVALKRSPRGGPENEKDKEPSLEQKAFNGFVRRGPESLPETERKALALSPDPSGGYLATSEFSRDLVKNLVEISPVRQAARVGSMRSTSITIPKRTAAPTAFWVSEQGTRQSTGQTYGQAEIVANEMAAYIDVSQQLLEDAEIDVEAEIAMDFAEEFGRLEGVAFISGNGVGKPRGFMTDSDITQVNSGSAATIADADGTADGLITAFYDLPSAYRNVGVWMMNSTTMGSVRKLKDGNNRYIWVDGIAPGQPPTILGRPVIDAPDMPDEGAGALPIAFGDFNSAYRIYDRVQMSLLRDPFTQATTGLVRFHARRRVGADVVKAEALRLVKCST